MAFDEKLAQRVRRLLPSNRKVTEKKMMGGLTFMVDEKMCVGILNEDLMARIGPEAHDEALTKRGCRAMDFTGRPMRGFVFVGREGTTASRSLQSWIRLAVDYNREARPSKGRKKKRKHTIRKPE